MTKTPLIERMTKGGAAKTWIREVESKDRQIKRLLQLKEGYLNIIDLLAREKEQLTKQVEDGRYAYSVIKECNRELEEENVVLKKDYYELIMAVGNKYEGETRHETALRYIFDAEKGSGEVMGDVSLADTQESEG